MSNTNDTDNVEKTWREFWCTPMQRVQNQRLYHISIYTVRSDGVNFGWELWPKLNATPADMSLMFANAFQKIETYRNCACVPEIQCVLHKGVYNPRSSEALMSKTNYKENV